MGKINLEMNAMDVIMTLSDGNPGAMKVLMDSFEQMPQIDPDDAFGSWGLLLHLDSMEIYGERIWMLYKDLCGQNMVNTIAMARAWQLGIVRSEDLRDAINGLTVINVNDVLDQVKDRLPNFAVEQEEPEEVAPPRAKKKDFIPAWMQRPESDYRSLFGNN